VQIEKRESKGFGMDDKICCLFAFSWKGSRILLVSPLILTFSSFTNNMVQGLEGKLFKLDAFKTWNTVPPAKTLGTSVSPYASSPVVAHLFASKCWIDFHLIWQNSKPLRVTGRPTGFVEVFSRRATVSASARNVCQFEDVRKAGADAKELATETHNHYGKLELPQSTLPLFFHHSHMLTIT
jgi:hypothetical protein